MSNDHSRQTLRIVDLEVRVAHQDKALAELNEMVTAQWRKIDALERMLKHLHKAFQELDAPQGGAEPPPPHY